MIQMTIFERAKMKQTFSQYFTDPHAKWTFSHMYFDQENECLIDFVYNQKIIVIRSYVGDIETIIQNITSWLCEFRFPYIVRYKEERITPFPETEKLMKFFASEVETLLFGKNPFYRERIITDYDLERNCLHIYYGLFDPDHLLISLTEENFQTWKEEVLQEKEKIKSFQNKIEMHRKRYPNHGVEESFIQKIWCQNTEDWNYIISFRKMKKEFETPQLSDEVLEDVLTYYNSYYAAETVLHKLVKEIQKSDPFVVINKDLYRNKYTIYAFGRKFEYSYDNTNYESELTLCIENCSYTILKYMYLLQDEEIVQECITTLLQNIKAARLSSVINDVNPKDSPIVTAIQLYFNVIELGGYRVEAADEIELKTALHEAWDVLKNRSVREDILEFGKPHTEFIFTEHYEFCLTHNSRKILIKEKEIEKRTK